MQTVGRIAGTGTDALALWSRLSAAHRDLIPPYPGAGVIPLVVTPTPPEMVPLPEGYTPDGWLVACYRGAWRKVYVRPCALGPSSPARVRAMLAPLGAALAERLAEAPRDGEQLLRVASCTAAAGVDCVDNGDGSFNRVLAYPQRRLSGSSPKASISWHAEEDLLLKASVGRGVRFPNVEELYNGTFTASAQTQSDPNLKAERSDALELSAEKDWEQHRLRVSVFHDAVRDAILRQSDTTVTPSVTRVSNVDRVKTSGLEIVWQTQDWLLRGLSLDANAAFAHSKVTANAADPASVGKYWLRVPKLRANLLATYRPTRQWMGSLGIRHSGRAYNDPYNPDVNPNVYGGVSSLNQLDLRATHKLSGHLTGALGINNVTDRAAHQAHPYPGRTLFAELRFTL